jgi:glycosyltransferase involved in cell wall biosynthesis
MNILMLTIGFRPNIGGIETHFDDFLKTAGKKNIKTTVLTYQPIHTSIQAKAVEKEKTHTIYRLPVVRGFFYAFVKKPILEFIYLVPGLFVATPVILFFKKIDVIHAHGLVAGFVGVFWGKVFRKRIIISTHSIYHFPKAGLYRRFAEYIFTSAHVVLCLSEQSVEEIKQLGVPREKVRKFTYWIDLDMFKIADKEKAKKQFGWNKKFVVFFVGRLVSEKGIRELLEAAKNFNKNIHLVIAGSGPMEEEIKKQRGENIEFVGRITNDKLPDYYNGADVLIVPSIHEEGFGRVLLESLACGTPVVAANRGGIREAIDATVGVLIDVSAQNISKTINTLSSNPQKMKRMSLAARPFVEKRYSEKNIDVIINSYLK